MYRAPRGGATPLTTWSVCWDAVRQIDRVALLWNLRVDDACAVPALLRALAARPGPTLLLAFTDAARAAPLLAGMRALPLSDWGVSPVKPDLLPRDMMQAYVVHHREYQTADYDGDVED